MVEKKTGNDNYCIVFGISWHLLLFWGGGVRGGGIGDYVAVISDNYMAVYPTIMCRLCPTQ